MLTEGVDSGKDFVGTDKNDIFEANGTTLTAFDKIDGGAGIDTLQITDAAGVMNTTIPAGMEIKNVEKMTVETAGSFGQVAAAPTAAVAAVKQVDTISFVINDATAVGVTYDVTYNGVTLTTAARDNTATEAEAAALVAGAINAIAGSTVATVVGDKVVVTAPVAGTPLSYNVVSSDLADTVTSLNVKSNQVAIEATSGTTAAVYDVSGIADLTDVKVTSAVNVNLKAATTTNVNVSGTTGEVQVDGGKNVTVTDAKAAVTLDNAKGNVTVTDATQTAAITITDGANVTVTTTATATAAINVGATNNTATGDVVVTQNLNSDGGAILNGGAITVTGGKTITVDVNSTNSATTATANIKTGTITVNGDANTTAVTVNQTEAVTAVPGGTATAAVTEVASVEFADINSGNTVILDGLTFTAAKALTAAEVAAAFANLKAGATHGQAKADNGIYSGVLANYNTGTVSADNKVVFTATEAKAIAPNLSNSGTGTVTAIVVTTEGVNAIPAVTAVGGIANGVVNIANGGTNNTIKTVTVDGYDTGSSVASDALTDLTLKNSAGSMNVDVDAANTFTLNVDNVNHTVSLDAVSGADIKTLTINATGEDSDFGLTAAAVETLTIAAAADLDVSGSTLSALKTVTISGTGDVDLGDVSGTTATTASITSTTTGKVSAQVDGTKFTVTTGAGDDTITVSGGITTVTKAISLGDGNDKLILSGITAVNADTAAISGGEGTDTIVLTAANAADSVLSSLANSIIFKSKVTGFEKLDIGAAGGLTTVNVGNLGFNYVVTNANTALLTLADMANNGTVELNGISSGGTTVLVKDAGLVGSTTDVLNVIANVANAGVNNGTLTAANVETINITATDTLLDNDGNGTDDAVDTSTLALVATSATAVTVTGNANLILNNSVTNVNVTSIDASTLTGNLTVTSQNATTSATIKGGLGNDNITAAYLDKVFGGAGNDTITAADLAELTGGTGADTFVAMTSTTKNSYATIKDFNKAEGDSIKFANATDFNNTKVTFASTIGFEEYLDKAASIASGGNGITVGTITNGVSWFTYTDAETGTNTYLVHNVGNDAIFTAGTDKVIKIAGVVDFSTAAFNDGTDTIAFA